MTNRLNYPSPYELSETIQEFCHKSFVNDFCSKKGIYITNANLEEQADFLSGLFFDHDELEMIRNSALGVHADSTLSGFWLQSEDAKYDLIYELEKHVGEIVDEKLKMKLGVITGNPTEGFRGSISYQQNQPGKLLFLQGTPRDFDFYIRRKGSGDWEIMIDGERSNDSKVMQKWLDKKIPKEAKIITIDQGVLSTKQTVSFFDQLTNRGVTNEWKFAQVKRIVLRREGSQDKDENDDEEKVIEQQSVLTGISQAILEGNDLRSNPFVKQCEDGGYRFTAMSYEYENKVHPYVMEVRAEFKGRPKVFEVALENYYRRIGVDEKLEVASTSQSNKMQLLSRFYSEAKILYDNLATKTLPVKNK